MQKNIRIFIIGAVLVAVSWLGFSWIQNYLQRSRASAAPPLASFSIKGEKVNPGDSFDLTLFINPNLTPFYSFDLAFTYDPAKVSFTEKDPANLLSNITPLSSKGDGVVDVQLLKGVGTTSIDTNTHTVRISALRVSEKNEPFTGRDALQMVQVSFVMNEGQSTPLDFKWVDPDTAKTSPSDSFQKVDLSYTGEVPTATPRPTSIAAVGAATGTPIPVQSAPGGESSALSEVQGGSPLAPTRIPTIMISSGKEGVTTFVRELSGMLYIDSLASYASPFRYEQSIKLPKGTYALLVGAKIYVRKERGVVVAVICNENTCGKKLRGQAMYVSSVFPVKADFSEMSDNIVIPDDADNKQYIFRIFCEDGSECEFDYISMEDAWGSQMLRNNHFGTAQQYKDVRMEPAGWTANATADYYSSVDPNYGYKGALMINNPAK